MWGVTVQGGAARKLKGRFNDFASPFVWDGCCGQYSEE